MKNNNYPLIFEAYFLDFSSPNFFNLETRVSITIPLSGESPENKETKMLSICFEMNSAFKNHDNTSHNDIVVIVDGFKTTNNGKDFIKEIKETVKTKNPPINKIIMYSSEAELYQNLIPQFEKFLAESYEDKWLNFFQEKKEKFPQKTQVKNKNIVDEKEKINLFTNLTSDKFKKIISDRNITYSTLSKTIRTTETIETVLSKTLGIHKDENNPNPLINELLKINKTFFYHQINDSLINTAIQTIKQKKI